MSPVVDRTHRGTRARFAITKTTSSVSFCVFSQDADGTLADLCTAEIENDHEFMEKIRRGIADADAGRVTSLDDIRRKYGHPKP